MAICEPTETTMMKRGHLTFELTTSALCDLDCSYCFEGAKTNPKRLDDLDILIKRINETLDSEWTQKYYSGVQLSFWGGEPTLNYNYIIRLMKEFEQDERVSFHIYSNGFNRKNWEKLIAGIDPSKLEVQISYDGKPIGDIFRVTNNGKPTSDIVLKNFDWFTSINFKSLYFKSTVPSKSIPNLYKTWLEFEQLHSRYVERDNLRISFAPTLDYSMTPRDEDERNSKIDIFKEQMLLIAKKEIEFYKKYGRHLCTWFAAGDSKVNCSAGMNMVAVDVDGKTYACHGTLYTPDKDLMRSSSIFDDDFVEKISKFNDSFVPSVTSKNPICESCVATTCLICPVASYELSKEKDFFSRWGDKQINGICSFYQTFGKIDRTVQNHLLESRYELQGE